MSDRFPAKIWIGGEISRTVLSGLIKALSQDGASHDFGEKGIDPDCTEAELRDYMADDGDSRYGAVLCLKDDQAGYGQFETTEQFCTENDISFDRWSEHYCEWDAENVYFRPGMNSPTIRFADARENEIVCGTTVRQALALLVTAEDSADEPGTLVDKAIRLLQDACPELPPNLESFKVV